MLKYLKNLLKIFTDLPETKMSAQNHFFKLKLKLTDLKLKLKSVGSRFINMIRSLNTETIKSLPYYLIRSIKSLILNTPSNLKEWDFKTLSGIIRFCLLLLLLGVIFAIAGSFYAFTANDAFISFRYVSNAINGWGYTFNPPPFEPISGFTSFLWLILLHGLWKIGFMPPQSADLATYLFSMGQVVLCFLFIRRMYMLPNIQRKSFYLFVCLCLVLLTNRTFLAFMTSGTEAALFNFLVLWWTFEATANKDRNPIYLSVVAVLLALCRTEGFIFIPASAAFLIFFFFQGHSKFKSIISFLLLGSVGFYYCWLNQTYGSFMLNSFRVFYYTPFPDFGRDYILSFVIEYALYFWLIFFIVWALFKFTVKRQKGFCLLFLLMLTFSAYIGFYLFIMGGDILEYRPLGFFIPLCTLAGIKMISENIVNKIRPVIFFILIYLLIGTAIPFTHRDLTKNLLTRRETEFLYRPVAQKVGWFGFFADKWDESQKKLIYQGVGLRHQEHKVLTEELLKTFPSRSEGSRITKSQNRLFAWDFVGVAGWVLPETIILDLSGQNNIIVTKSPLKYKNHRLMGHEHATPVGYVQCFNGGSNLAIDPFSGKKNLRLLRSAPLSDGQIKGCESFWKSQINAGKAKSLRQRTR